MGRNEPKRVEMINAIRKTHGGVDVKINEDGVAIVRGHDKYGGGQGSGVRFKFGSKFGDGSKIKG